MWRMHREYAGMRQFFARGSYIDDSTRDPYWDVKTPAISKFIQEQWNDLGCHAAAQAFGFTASKVDYDNYAVLVRQSTIDETLHMVVAVSLRPRPLFISHYRTLQDTHGEDVFRNQWDRNCICYIWLTTYAWLVINGNPVSKMDFEKSTNEK